MDGIHDLGGMDGFGPVEIEADEPVFHEPWEGWVYSLQVAGMGSGAFNIDEFRHAIERLPPTEYLASSYYERWLAAVEQLFVENGVLAPDAIDDRQAALASDEATFPDDPDVDAYGRIAAGLRETFDVDRPERELAFAVGDRIRVRNRHPEGHTRCPQYVRRAEGVVESVRGTEVVPDSRAHGGDDAEPVYNVRFAAEELWGPEEAEGGGVHLDLWERYLEPADWSDE